MIPDAEGLVREWLREQPSIVALTDNRQFFRMPEKERPELPCIVLIRVGGHAEDEIDYPWISFSCWGANKNLAGKIAYELATVLDLASQAQPMALNSGLVKSVYDVTSPQPIAGVDWAKAFRVQARFMTQAL